MTDSPRLPRVFIGSSSEGKEVAANLQVELGGACEVKRWDQNVFEPSGYALDSLIRVAQIVDFAVMIATPDDVTDSRGTVEASLRDNVVLEFGLFAGVVGRDRTYLLATSDVKLPTDTLGITRLAYNPQPSGDQLAALTQATLQIGERIKDLGLRNIQAPTGNSSSADVPLLQEIDLLCSNAVAQGWTVKKNDTTTLRLCSPRGKDFVLQKRKPMATRIRLRRFASELRASGLRVNGTLRNPVDDSPF